MDNILEFPSGKLGDTMAELFPNVTFSVVGEQELTMQILCPWDKEKKYPAVLFIQGSAWTTPNMNWQLPQLAELSRQGFIVASASHRDCRENNPFPAFLKDIKTAIRFLKAHSREYGVDKGRIAVWGTSSGGNAALLAGMTGDWPCYRTEEFSDESDKVQLVIDCFGPTDLSELVRGAVQAPEGQVDPRMIYLVSDGKGGISAEKIRDMSPLHIECPGQEYPAFLLLHGDADQIVPYHQSEKLYQKLREDGYDVNMVRIKGGAHEGNFWTPELLDYIGGYITKKL